MKLYEELLNIQTSENDLVTPSLMVMCMTFLVLDRGVSSPIGMVALALQAGLLVRINYQHRKALGENEKSVTSRS